MVSTKWRCLDLVTNLVDLQLIGAGDRGKIYPPREFAMNERLEIVALPALQYGLGRRAFIGKTVIGFGCTRA